MWRHAEREPASDSFTYQEIFDEQPITSDDRPVPRSRKCGAWLTAPSERGYSKDDINVVMSEDTKKRHFSAAGTETELGTKAAEGAGVGGAIGGTLGAIAAAVAAVGTTIALPGLGLVIAGPLAAAIAGAGAGAATGGLVGALVGWNIPEGRVKRYDEGIRKGGILMGVRPKSDDDATHFESEWKNYRAQDVYR